MNVNGDPYVIEYNVRLGDPETEAILPRIQTDLFELFRALHDGELANFQLEVDARTAATVVLVAGGYPEEYDKGDVIQGLEQVSDEVLTFHAGTAINNQGQVVSNGGRVLALTALGPNLPAALAQANAAAEQINWSKRYFRSDIGFDLLSQLAPNQ
jgi:phosphoribosylamine--glycine ligase